ncbi:MAG: 50S ribosome-binding GTPase, partial [Lachnospiraceae bacterium]|nr:50S ribosome-binding GTPase [Lachnospiraceae bacterium]
MSLNDTPSSERIHIGFFGRRNAGKSSVVNAVTGQDLAVVSDTKGTTTDPVSKAMELLPLGPVVVIDTPGFDDEGELGALRVRKTKQTLNRVDLAVLIVDVQEGLKETEKELLELFKTKEIPWVVAWNKADLLETVPEAAENEIYVSATEGTNIYELKDLMAKVGKLQESKQVLVRDLMKPDDVILLVMPIDSAAPKGRMILPQQMMIRDVLDGDGLVFGIKEDKVKE